MPTNKTTFLAFLRANATGQDRPTIVEAYAILKEAITLADRQNACAFAPGDIVTVEGRRSGSWEGRVDKINAKNLKITNLETGQRWNVHPSFCKATGRKASADHVSTKQSAIDAEVKRLEAEVSKASKAPGYAGFAIPPKVETKHEGQDRLGAFGPVFIPLADGGLFKSEAWYHAKAAEKLAQAYGATFVGEEAF